MNRKLFRPTLTEMKEPHTNSSRSHSPNSGPQPHKKPAPPEQTHAENFYWIKQMQARTPVVIVMAEGETLHGVVEWYDRDCIQVTRAGSTNVMISKPFIKYIYKDGPTLRSAAATGSFPACG